MSCKKGSKHLSADDKSRVARILSYFKSQSKKGDASTIQKTVEATGFSRRTVFRIQRELNATGKLSSPQRRERGPYKPIDSFDESVIRNKVREFYTIRKQLPTLRNLHTILKSEIDYPGSRELLRTTLRSLGFSWKTADNRKMLIEKPAIVLQRLTFYSRKKELEENGYTFVYVDETWIDTASTKKRCWQGPEVIGLCPPCNRGQRLIVVHAGTSSGFVDGAQLVYKASSSTGDYHSQMDGKNFTKWLEEKLLPNLNGKCANVMDNASNHSMQSEKCPTSSTRKNDIKIWLQNHSITFKDNLLKPQLLELARLHKPPPAYVIDRVIKSQGHEVLRLPPYQPEFNAIELIWSQLKDIVRQRNVTFRLDDIMKITSAAFAEIWQDRWKRACDHVEKAIEQMKAADHYTGDPTEPTIIHLSGDTSDSENGSSTDTASETEGSL